MSRSSGDWVPHDRLEGVRRQVVRIGGPNVGPQKNIGRHPLPVHSPLFSVGSAKPSYRWFRHHGSVDECPLLAALGLDDMGLAGQEFNLFLSSRDVVQRVPPVPCILAGLFDCGRHADQHGFPGVSRLRLLLDDGGPGRLRRPYRWTGRRQSCGPDRQARHDDGQGCHDEQGSFGGAFGHASSVQRAA